MQDATLDVEANMEVVVAIIEPKTSSPGPFADDTGLQSSRSGGVSGAARPGSSCQVICMYVYIYMFLLFYIYITYV